MATYTESTPFSWLKSAAARVIRPFASQQSPAKTKAALQDEIATDRLIQWIFRIPDPDEVLRKRGIGRAQLRALEWDDEIAQCLGTRREAVIATPWRLEPQKTRANQWLAAEIAPHIEALIRGAFNAVPYGYSVVEVVYIKRPDGRIGIKMLSEKPLEWFAPQRDGSLRYFPNDGSAGFEGIEVDPMKFLLTRHMPSYRQPYGEALLSTLYWTAFHRSNGRKYWVRFLERFGEPILVGSVSNQEKFVSDVMAMNLAAAFPVQPGESVAAISASQSGEFERFDHAMNKSIQKVILGQTLTSEMGARGNSGATEVHNEVRNEKRNADIRLISGTVQNLVNVLAILNGFFPPQFFMADETGLELDRATRDAILCEKNGVEFNAEYYIDNFGLSEAHFAIRNQNIEPTARTPSALPIDASASLLTPAFTQGQRVIEHGVDETLTQATSPISGADINAAIQAATDPADLEDRLAVVLKNSDRATFRRTMERAIFAADIIGYAHASSGSENASA